MIDCIRHLSKDIAEEAARPQNARLLNVSTFAGIAYTDGLVISKKKLPALSLISLPNEGELDQIRWHQMSDTCEQIDKQGLQRTAAFPWQFLQVVDL